MNELKLQRAWSGVWTRYLNIPMFLWFLSDVPMPADKQLLALSAGLTLAGNVCFHLSLWLTRRHRTGSYLMLGLDHVAHALALYASGVVVSPFLLLYPLLSFSAYFVDFDKRVAGLFGLGGMILLGAVYAVWWHAGPAPIAWEPRSFPAWVWSICAIQILTLSAFIFLATETNPLVEELSRREQALLKQAHKAELGTSLSMIAHELRNPLTTIGFSLELMRHAVKGNDPKFQKAARSAEEELARMSRMVQDVLAFARERRGMMQPADHAPVALMERAVEFLRLKWGRHHRKFAVEADLAGAPMVRCDADAMHQVLVNVLDNAIQHGMPDRPLRVEVRHAAHDGRVSFIVRDNGTGIPAARLARLFEGFVTDRAEGTGLGLIISRQLMEDQAGAFDISSTEGAGTTVVLSLPAGGPAEAAQATLVPVPVRARPDGERPPDGARG